MLRSSVKLVSWTECGNKKPKDNKAFNDYSASVDTNQVHKNHIEQNMHEGKQYPCVGCKYSWKERHHVKSHIIQNIEVFFCLNCDDWIQEKSAIFETGWTMFDETGGLKYDV